VRAFDPGAVLVTKLLRASDGRDLEQVESRPVLAAKCLPICPRCPDLSVGVAPLALVCAHICHG
jgi:hypothetical protein